MEVNHRQLDLRRRGIRQPVVGDPDQQLRVRHRRSPSRGRKLIDSSARVHGASYTIDIDATGDHVTDADDADVTMLDGDGDPLASPAAFRDGHAACVQWPVDDAVR